MQSHPTRGTDCLNPSSMTATRKGGDLTPAVFTYGANQQVRTLAIAGQPWFVAKDVCGILGIANSRHALDGLDEDEVMVSPMATPSRGRQQMQVVSESGLYNLVFRSRKAEARAFRRWVTAEVLPSIRRTGGYARPVAVPKVAPALPAPSPAVWDARHLPFEQVAFKRGVLRFISLHGNYWYSLRDVLAAINCRTGAQAVARSLPTDRCHLVHLYGSINPAWCVDETALRMVLVSRGQLTSQLTLNIA